MTICGCGTTRPQLTNAIPSSMVAKGIALSSLVTAAIILLRSKAFFCKYLVVTKADLTLPDTIKVASAMP